MLQVRADYVVCAVVLLWTVLAVARGSSTGSSVLFASDQDHIDCRGFADAQFQGTELLYAFIIFRHGDRTPKRHELLLAPKEYRNVSFFPYGEKALTNKGKLRMYDLGKHLRCRYSNFVNNTYVPGQTVMNVTLTDRTKMSAALVLAGLYPPTEQQTWLPGLVWQPVPYYEHPVEGRDFDECPRHGELVSALRDTPINERKFKEYENTLRQLRDVMGLQVNTLEDVRQAREAIKGLINVGVPLPPRYEEYSKKIDEMATAALSISYDSPELIRLAAGTYINSFIEATTAIISKMKVTTRLQLLSAHEVSVAGLMSSVGAFTPHIPDYGSSFTLELRRNKNNGSFVVAAIHAESPDSQPRLLPLPHCNDAAVGTNYLCDYSMFRRLVEPVRISRPDVAVACKATRIV